MDKLYLEDIEEIIAHRYDNGADYWTTEDRKLLKGAPFTTLESPMYLLELGVSPQDAILTETAELIFSTWREDGRFKTSPSGGLYPCHTALALRNLCVLGYAEDQRLLKTFDYFISTQQEDRGWKESSGYPSCDRVSVDALETEKANQSLSLWHWHAVHADGISF